uniref:Uncharacterized protein n=1 Tax=Babesia bovis TaxID=5865 RepID=S6B1X1_BABBO|nr:hypothetical protein [Babesia bovis]
MLSRGYHAIESIVYCIEYTYRKPVVEVQLNGTIQTLTICFGHLEVILRMEMIVNHVLIISHLVLLEAVIIKNAVVYLVTSNVKTKVVVVKQMKAHLLQ